MPAKVRLTQLLQKLALLPGVGCDEAAIKRLAGDADAKQDMDKLEDELQHLSQSHKQQVEDLVSAQQLHAELLQ